MPGSPPALLGVRNLRGAVLPVVRLAAVVGAQGGEAPKRVLVVEEESGAAAGFAIDEVLDVGEIGGVDEAADSALLTSQMLTDGGELVGLLDVGRVLAVVRGGATP